MSDKKPMPVDGGGAGKGQSDGVNDPVQRGRSAGGESGGGGYANPHTGKDGDQSGFMGHGGQAEIGYHGGGQMGTKGAAADNSTTRGDGDLDGKSEAGPGPGPGPNVPDQDKITAQTHEASIDGRTVQIVNESGVAAAEAGGNTGAPNE